VKKYLPLLVAFIFVSASAFAQTTVTATVTDPNGNPYANGTASAQSVAASGQATIYTTPIPTSGAGFFSMTLNAATYVFTVCAPPTQLGPSANPTPTQVCFQSGPIAISGGTQDVSIQLNASSKVIGPSVIVHNKLEFSYQNSSDGTVCYGFAKMDTTVSPSTLGFATSTNGSEVFILGAVESGCGTSGNAMIVTNGAAQVVFDSATVTVGDAVGLSSTTGLATDLGSPSPTSGQTIVASVTLSPSGALPSACTVAPGCWVQVNPPGSSGSGGGGSGGSGGSGRSFPSGPTIRVTTRGSSYSPPSANVAYAPASSIGVTS